MVYYGTLNNTNPKCHSADGICISMLHFLTYPGILFTRSVMALLVKCNDTSLYLGQQKAKSDRKN